MIKALTINDISAYFDGTISDERRRDVVEALRTDVVAAALLQQYRQQREELHRLYDGVLSEPVPERMLSLLRQRRGH